MGNDRLFPLTIPDVQVVLLKLFSLSCDPLALALSAVKVPKRLVIGQDRDRIAIFYVVVPGSEGFLNC